ncbi:MAG: hypothetical protein ABR975_13530 [Vulcanimicrobiaceae bacterium]
MIRPFAAAGLAGLLLVGIAPPAHSQESSPPITVISCLVEAYHPTQAQIRVRFRNDGPRTYDEITFRARYGRVSWADFTDKGTFSPGAIVKVKLERTDLHTHGDDDYIYWGPEACSVVATHTNDGVTWRDPTAPLADNQFATPEPDDAPPLPAAMTPGGDPIGLVGCRLSVGTGVARFPWLSPDPEWAILLVRFRNLAEQPLDRVVFRVAYENGGGMDFAMTGRFEPHVLTNSAQPWHKKYWYFAAERAVSIPEWTGIATFDDPHNCTTVSVRYVDGTVWQNPDVGPTEPPVPTAPP